MESISEAFNKCFVADYIFSLSRTTQDKQSNKGRIYIAKNRNGPDGLVYPIFMDTSCVKIKVLPPEDGTVQISDSDLKKTQLKKLRNKYKQFKEGANSGVIE